MRIYGIPEISNNYPLYSDHHIKGVILFYFLKKKKILFNLNGPQITYFFFINDSLLFWQARLADLEVIQDILAVYERVSFSTTPTATIILN